MNQNELFTIRYAPGNNNNGDGVSQAINRMSEDHRNCNMAAILAKDLTDVLNFCLERNTAIHMQHSQDFNEDMAISAVINTMIGLSKVTVEQAGSDIDRRSRIKFHLSYGRYVLLDTSTHMKATKGTRLNSPWRIHCA